MSDDRFNEFYWEMRRFVPPDARILTCQFRGDPNSDVYQKWRARILNDPAMVDDMANVYLCVSAMKQNTRGEFRRRKECFRGGLLLMIDDIGEGKGAKFPVSVLDPLPPTAMIETSPDNYQAVYFFDSLVQDLEQFDALIRAFIERQFLGNDTGQAGVNRVFRPPIGINGKEKYMVDGKPWKVRCAEFHPQRRYSVQQIAEAFKLDLVRRVRVPKAPAADKGDRVRAFVAVRAALRSSGMLKVEEPDYSGWMQVQCPWVHNHTDQADNGAAIRLPEEENDFYGAFRCHHGHCDGKGWRELTHWLVEEQAEVLEMVNRQAGQFNEYNWEK